MSKPANKVSVKATEALLTSVGVPPSLAKILAPQLSKKAIDSIKNGSVTSGASTTSAVPAVSASTSNNRAIPEVDPEVDPGADIFSRYVGPLLGDLTKGIAGGVAINQGMKSAVANTLAGAKENQLQTTFDRQYGGMDAAGNRIAGLKYGANAALAGLIGNILSGRLYNLSDSIGAKARQNQLDALYASGELAPSYYYLNENNLNKRQVSGGTPLDVSMPTVSDKHVKDIEGKKYTLSDKDIKDLLDKAGDPDITDSDDDDTILNKYAEHLKNYLYTYKPEACQIDDSIDPEEEHVGPMAQDIEQVAPDCVKETPEGVKVVDGNRLALVNAGAIGDIARELDELKSKLAAITGVA